MCLVSFLFVSFVASKDIPPYLDSCSRIHEVELASIGLSEKVGPSLIKGHTGVYVKMQHWV